MRHILLDRARRRVAAKRGGNAERVDLDELPDLSGDRAKELIALEDALNALAAIDARKARVVELRFYGGLSVEESAAVLEISPETVMRDWRFALAAGRTERPVILFQKKIHPGASFLLRFAPKGQSRSENSFPCLTGPLLRFSVRTKRRLI
jgi:DNA-directed RNA polymerase specialized sigma24 family protein